MKVLSAKKEITPWVKQKKHCFKFSFTDKVKAYFKGSENTSDGGLITIRELDEKVVRPKYAIPGLAWLADCRDIGGNMISIFETDKNAK